MYKTQTCTMVSIHILTFIKIMEWQNAYCTFMLNIMLYTYIFWYNVWAVGEIKLNRWVSHYKQNRMMVVLDICEGNMGVNESSSYYKSLKNIMVFR